MVIPQDQFTSRSLALRLVPFLVAFMLLCLAKAQIFLHSNCPDTAFSSNRTVGGQYQTNLDRLLIRSLYNGGKDSIFSNATVGSYPDEVYGLFLCRGDVLVKTCQDCIDAASTTIVRNCSYSKEAIIWYDQCLIRYSNTSFFSTLETTPYLCWSNHETVTEPNNFSQMITDMFRNLTDQATNNPANRMYAKAELTIIGIGNLSGMVQCTPDLSPLQCQDCLSSALANFANNSFCPEGKRGRRILTPSCNTRYELYPFLEDPISQPPDLGNRTDNGGKVKIRILYSDESDHLPGDEKAKALAIEISTIVSATLVIVILGISARYFFRRKGLEENDSPEDQFLELTENNYFPDNFNGEEKVESNKFPLIRLNLIRTATQQFSMENKLGEGGFGPVYKGTLVDGKEIAVKRLSKNSGQGLQEFKAEVTSIARLQHKNLVKLLGCCLEGKELLLVYDYMPNKSLDVHIFDIIRGAHLDWKRRLDIINGIARGILYLHEDSRFKIIHRDLKASNILLDHDMNPKISDFGMARIFGSKQIEANTERVVGTHGYMAPEYAMEGIFSVKSDVYSFGVLLLEIVSGKRNGGFHLKVHGHSLLTHAWKLWSAGRGLDFMDPLLSNTYVESEVLKCIQIGLLCIQEDPADRSTMSSVIVMLGSYTMPVTQPKEPKFSVGRAVPFSQQPSLDLESSVSGRQVMPSPHVKCKEIELSATICDLTLSDSLPR